tara:strand:+ start:75 stop:245 length:171 start_codon:yes stop_codon:yes gene_type:complete
MNKRQFDELVNEYGVEKANLARAWFFDTTNPIWRAQLDAVKFLIANEILWNPGAWS